MRWLNDQVEFLEFDCWCSEIDEVRTLMSTFIINEFQNFFRTRERMEDKIRHFILKIQLIGLNNSLRNSQSCRHRFHGVELADQWCINDKYHFLFGVQGSTI